MTHAHQTVAVIGGSGKLGAALARRWARAGIPLAIGSREPGRAAEAAARLSRESGVQIASGTNSQAAAQAGVIVVCVPYDAQERTLADIRTAAAGKLVVDTTVPLVPPRVMRVQLPPEGCAALRAARLLGESVTVASAFHNVAAHRLATDETIDCDVLVFADRSETRQQVIGLARAAGLRGLHGGPLANSAATEALTSVLIFINKTYAVDGAGLRITGALTGGE
ncbi:MAG: NADPH-dependent F420 reductase [Proteobacteria bacterium]|nr:NADPH-dependent F420 reductase [Pseudomonadota bacterium]